MYSKYRRLERELLDIAKSFGYNGTPFLRHVPPIGHWEDEEAAITLSLSVRPRPETNWQRQLVRRWARNIIFSSTPPQVAERNGASQQRRHRAW